MTMQELDLGFQEKLIFQLRSIFEGYGYSQYKMNKFEEYDLYARNKDFLLTDSVITFTDFGGRLMALKPDVTLSIVKNSRDDLSCLQKLYYNENVYRVDGGHSFKEMMQVGLECIGNVDDCCILEVLTLAAKSLKKIGADCILDVSHLGILTDVLKAAGIPENRQDTALKYFSEKNLHELTAYCRSIGVSDEKVQWLIQLLSAHGSPQTVLPVIKKILSSVLETESIDRLIQIFAVLQDSGVEDIFRFDFSAVDDIRYYNGIVFKGFIHGLSSSVLSGGQYDNLMKKMHHKAGAVGFAVYIDRLEQLEPKRKSHDVDVVLLYDDTASLADIAKQANRLRRNGHSVMVQQQKPEQIRYKQLMKLRFGEVEILENNA